MKSNKPIRIHINVEEQLVGFYPPVAIPEGGGFSLSFAAIMECMQHIQEAQQEEAQQKEQQDGRKKRVPRRTR